MGSPGSGKSTVARILAKKLNKPSIDIDNDILEPMWGVKISEKVSSLNHEYVLYCLISVEVIKIGNCESIVLERLHPKFNVCISNARLFLPDTSEMSCVFMF